MRGCWQAARGAISLWISFRGANPFSKLIVRRVDMV